MAVMRRVVPTTSLNDSDRDASYTSRISVMQRALLDTNDDSSTLGMRTSRNNMPYQNESVTSWGRKRTVNARVSAVSRGIPSFRNREADIKVDDGRLRAAPNSEFKVKVRFKHTGRGTPSFRADKA